MAAGLPANPSSVHGPGGPRGRRSSGPATRSRGSSAREPGGDRLHLGRDRGRQPRRPRRRPGGRARPIPRARRVSSRPPSTRPSAKRRSPSRRTASSPSSCPVDSRGVPATRPVPAGAATALVSAILANNETGAVFDGLPAFAASGPRGRAPLVHTDAVQAAGKIPVDVRGARRRPPLARGPQVRRAEGGRRPLGAPRRASLRPRRRRRAGAGSPRRHRERRGPRGPRRGAPARAASVSRTRARGSRALRDRFEAGLLAAVPAARLNAAAGARLPTATSVVFPGTEAETLVAALDLEGIAVSAGSACHAGTTAPSRVLLALGLTPADAKATLRFSFGRATSAETSSGSSRRSRGSSRGPGAGRPD